VKILTDVGTETPNSLPVPILEKLDVLVRDLTEGLQLATTLQEVHQTPQYICLTSSAPFCSVAWKFYNNEKLGQALVLMKVSLFVCLKIDKKGESSADDMELLYRRRSVLLSQEHPWA
jgi:hypothetical protein